MKVVIVHKGVKRKLAGPFAICLSDEDRISLRRQLKQKDFHYGWIDICEEPDHGPANTEPIDWSSTIYCWDEKEAT